MLVLLSSPLILASEGLFGGSVFVLELRLSFLGGRVIIGGRFGWRSTDHLDEDEGIDLKSNDLLMYIAGQWPIQS